MQELIKQLAGLALLQSQSTTPRPWKYETKGNTVQSYAIPGVCSGISPKTGNAVFIAAAGSFDFAALLAEVEGLAAQPAPLADAALADWQAKLNASREAFAAWDASPHDVTIIQVSDQADIDLGRATCEYLPGVLARLAAAEATLKAVGDFISERQDIAVADGKIYRATYGDDSPQFESAGLRLMEIQMIGDVMEGGQPHA